MNIFDVLNLFKSKIEALNPIDKKYLISRGNQNGFEDLVPEIAEAIKIEIANPNIFDYKVHLGHHFPDMDLIVNGECFGLELKSRNNGSWDTNGNSVFESITDEDYQDILLLFGSKEPRKDHLLVRFDYYWKVTSAINVTHSPRFKINMDTTESVFKDAQEYHQLRDKTETEKVSFLQNYLKEHTTGTKWFVPQDSSSESIKPTSLNLLPQNIQNQVKAEVLVLFPQDLITSKKANYARAHEFIITNHFYFSSSFRDFFSAGGKWERNNVEFPQSVGTFHSLSSEIRYILNNSNSEFQKLAYESWNTLELPLNRTSFYDDYCKVVDLIGRVNFYPELQDSKIQKLFNLL